RAGLAAANAQVRLLDDPLSVVFALSYSVVRATTPLLRFCLDRLSAEDQFGRQLLTFYQRAARDEEGHDRQLLDDARRLGLDASRIVDVLPPAPITAMVGSQYYLIAHCHPALHLGYIGLLEGFSATFEEVQRLAALVGVSAGAFSTLKLH